METTWIEIEGTDGRYSVSSLGAVRANWSDVPRRNCNKRVRIEKTKLLKSFVHTTGYLRVSLGRNKSRYVHRLVASAFIPNPDNLPQVDHIDGNKQNNNINNLRWVTAQQNSLYGGDRHNWESQRIASAKRRIHEAKKQEYKALFDEGHSLRQIAKLFGTSHSAISLALKT